MNVIEISNIHLKYADKEIFNDFSLSIKKGEKLLITGKSGKGKSTLFELLLGFADAKSGEIFINGKRVEAEGFTESRKCFAYVNQDVTLRKGKARDVLKEISKFSDNHYDGEFDENLAEFFEFDSKLLDKDIEELSGGERQRLGIILAIMLKRPIFLLDEVTSALDRELKKKVVHYFSTCEQTVIAISHDTEWLANNQFQEVKLS